MQGRVQLDLFIPYEYGYDFKVIVTNKQSRPRALAFTMDVVRRISLPNSSRRHRWTDVSPSKAGNQVYIHGRLAHNLSREMQMLCHEQKGIAQKNVRHCGTSSNSAPAPQTDPARREPDQAAGKPHPDYSANRSLKSESLHYLDVLKRAA